MAGSSFTVIIQFSISGAGLILYGSGWFPHLLLRCVLLLVTANVYAPCAVLLIAVLVCQPSTAR
jgi:hypothetical protein